MKVIAVIFVLALAAVNAKPAPKQGDDVEVVPLEKNYSQGKYPVIDVPAGGAGVGSVGLDDDDDVSGLGVGGHGLDNIFEQMERMMARMREQMSYFWRGSPAGAVDTEDVDDFGTGGFQFPRFPEIDLSKAKNTSVTKDINGHKVLVNETDYEDKTGNSFVKVHFVNIAPAGGFQGTEKTITSTSNAPRDVEPIESQENEIPKGKQAEVGSVVPEKVRQALD